jgi:RHS repeat-associated protein
MKTWRRLLELAGIAICVSIAGAQTPPPILGNIEAPYAPLLNSVTIAKTAWAPGIVAYGPAGTPLVLSGSNLGGGGSVQFIAYKNGVVDTSIGVNGAISATVTLWTSNMLVLTVPSGAMTGLVKVTVEGQTSNPLPFLVTPGQYSGSCPAGPPGTQLQITTSSLHDGAVNRPYSAALSSQGGTGQITWSTASGTLPSGLTLNQPNSTNGYLANISGTPTSTTGSNPTPLTFKVTDSSNPQQLDEAEISLTIQPQAMTSAIGIYGYNVSYDYAGNVTQFQDGTYNTSNVAGSLPLGPGVMGKWSITAPGGGNGYDNLNRLAGASVTWPDGTAQSFCWQYDAFGNRLEQEISSAAFQSGSGGANACQPQASATVATSISSYYTSNQVASTNARGVTATPTYDQIGDPKSDGVNQYIYDAEGRICAVSSTQIPGITTMTGYIYDADGTRVAKGTITSLSCDPTSNGFQFSENYVLGPGGEELTMIDGQGNWQRTNLYAGGKLAGTYDLVWNSNYNSSQPVSSTNPQQIPWLHFHLEDALGTRRMQISGMLGNLGQPEMDLQSLPFGDQVSSFLDPNADQAADQSNLGSIPLGSTPLFFTGKERDSESGNDYFGARYYASSMGRFMSPDPVVISPELDNPQSWNKYSYTFNRPLSLTDPDGKWPGWYHTELDRNFFGNQLHWSMHDQQVIVQESALQDSFGILSGRNGQSTENVRWHGMDNFWNQVGPEQAIADSESYISQSLNQAVYWQLRADYEGADCSSCHDASLQSLADAEHAAQDLSSPEHGGKPWTMWGGAKHWYDERHSAMSSNPSDEEARAEAIYLTQVTYSRYQQQLTAARKKQKGPPSWNCLVNASCQ